jgi:release factor glutamine methyltransferase
MTAWQTAETLQAAARRLAAAGIDEPLREARLLAREAKDAAAFDAFIARRERREPVAYILGRKEFWSLEFEVSPAVLIPRPDTETVVELALAALKKTPPARILDLGTGSGCLLISLLTEFPHASGTGLDISPDALGLAARNAARLGVAARASFVHGDFGAHPLEGRFDLVVSNPPYIPDADIARLEADVRNHEPRLALSGGTTGLASIERIAAALRDVLDAQGLALIEIGHDQAKTARAVLEDKGLEVARIAKDLAGRDRVAVVRLPQSPGD